MRSHRGTEGTERNPGRVPQIRLRVPKFKSEAEEAAWWDAHPEVIVKAVQEGCAAWKLPARWSEERA
jgi:hypothetical protein